MFKHYCAINDFNGNPRRCFVLIDDDGTPKAVWDEGYYGSDAVPGIWRKHAYNSERIDCSVRFYHKLLKSLPSPAWASQVPGWEHLADLEDAPRNLKQL